MKKKITLKAVVRKNRTTEKKKIKPPTYSNGFFIPRDLRPYLERYCMKCGGKVQITSKSLHQYSEMNGRPEYAYELRCENTPKFIKAIDLFMGNVNSHFYRGLGISQPFKMQGSRKYIVNIYEV